MTTIAPVHDAALHDRQFSLRALFGTMTLVAVFLAITTQLPGLVGGTFVAAALFWPVGLIVAGVFRGSKGQVQAGFVILPLWLFFVAMMMPCCTCGGRVASRNSQCINQLKNIAIALQNYEAVHGTLPPAYFADADGKPIHSWRVMLLPFLEQELLYEQYSFDEPWDGPNNRLLHSQVVRYYECPAVSFGSTETSYLAVVGKETIWPGRQAPTSAALVDGSSNTLQVVEVARSGIHWMEPRDLTFSGMPFKLNAKIPGGIRSHHKEHCNVARCDGSVTSLPNDISPAEVRALLTAAGNEDMTRFVRKR